MRGIRLVTIGLTSWLVFSIIAILLGLSTFSMERVMDRQDKLQNLSLQYEDLARELIETSEGLTDEARSFVTTGESRHLTEYLQQVETLKTRERTVQQIKNLGSGLEELRLIATAKAASDQLVWVDIRAMRLAFEARGGTDTTIPQILRSSEVTQEEKLLSPAGKLEKARSLLFEPGYESNRETVARAIAAFGQSVRTKLLKEKRTTDILTSDTRNLQSVLALIVLVGIAGVLIIIYLMMTRPIQAYIEALENDEEHDVNLLPMGTKEMRVLAETFNQRTNQLYAAQQELRKLATTDFLTGSFNRRMFLELGEKEVRRAERYGYPLSVLMLDIDFFKRVNDGYGHHFGDRVLQFLVQKGQEVLRPSDIFGRMGGEEFAVLLPETDGETALSVAERLRQEYEKARIMTDEGEEIRFTVSIGVVFRKPGELYLENILKRADEALYEAKNSGRNRCVKGT